MDGRADGLRSGAMFDVGQDDFGVGSMTEVDAVGAMLDEGRGTGSLRNEI